MDGIERLIPHLAAVLLTYAVYSTVASVVLWVVVRPRWIATPGARVRCLRAGLLAPIPLALLSTWLAPSWSPVVTLAFEEAPERRAHVEAPFDDATVRRGDDVRGATERPLVDPFSATKVDAATPALQGARSDNRAGEQRSLPGPEQLAVVAVGAWLTLAVLGSLGTVASFWSLRKLVASGRPVRDASLHQEFQRLKRRAGCSRQVELLASECVDSPLVLGIRRAWIIVPADWFKELSPASQRAILAHELAHVVRRDPLWNLIVLWSLRIAWFQPLNRLWARRLRSETEFCADRFAATLLADPMELAWSLVDAAERLLKTRGRRRATPLLAASISAFESGLEQRVAAVLTPLRVPSSSRASSLQFALVLLVGCTVLSFAVPRFQTARVEPFLDVSEKPMMRHWIAQTGLVAGLLFNPLNPASSHVSAADEQETARPEAAKPEAAKPDAAQSEPVAVPEELQQFNGMLIGRLVDRDIERGVFAVKVDYVARVWENSRARNPRAAVGKTLRVDGVVGKWLDQLLLIRPGETLEFEAQHRGGDTLTFPGEWLKKTTPFQADQHPVPPDGFRGFAGVITGKIERKNMESHDLIVRVDAVEKTFEQSRAENADAVLGKSIVLAGFWGKFSQPLEKLKAGDRIRAGVLHRVPKSDHFTVAEFVEPATGEEGREPAKRDSASRPAPARPSPDAKDSADGFPAGMQGFRGILRGKLVSRDVEKGELVFRAERATRTWQENKATDTESCRGREFVVKRIAGKWLDVLVTLEPGDSIEVEAFHNGGRHLDFVSEWLKKVE